ncbi:receptor-like protein EIX1 [Camellia sinensis]|uniref:receptor-like protein EIX1 n=1 Tax=Camellia sinensis TaxID=4442 RepID=UPI0010355D8B|nr:receptor-like protein EIX1 [Camellia sinensis]
MTDILIETDSERVVLFIKGDTPPNFAQRALLEDTKFLMHRCNCSISYTPREANKCADGLANLGATHQDNLVVLDDPPSAIGPFLVLLSNLTSLRHLDLSVCALEILSLRFNQLSSHLPDELEQFKLLQFLNLRNNLLSGSIPTTIGRLASLEYLDFERNQLNGTLPQSFGHLSKLQQLYVSNNMLEDIVSEIHFTNLINLNRIYGSGNQLTLKVSRDWIPPFQLIGVELASWNLGPKFPIWLRPQKDLAILDLSYTGILDEIPIWFWKFSSSLYFVDLLHNQIHGEILYLFIASKVQHIYLNFNHFSGPLPRISSNLEDLHFSNNSFSRDISHFLCDRKDKQKKLAFLDLGENLLSGEIPDCSMSWQSLILIEMGNNNLTGNIPRSMGHLGGLQSLHLRNNSFSGEMPLSLQNWTNL